MATLDHHTSHVRWYVENPDSGLFEHIRTGILAHDPTCASLRYVWLGRKGGVSCPSDISTCDDCDVTFYNEGLMGQYSPDWKLGEPVLQTRDEDDGEEYDAKLCDCCGRKRQERNNSDTRRVAGRAGQDSAADVSGDESTGDRRAGV